MLTLLSWITNRPLADAPAEPEGTPLDAHAGSERMESDASQVVEENDAKPSGEIAAEGSGDGGDDGRAAVEGAANGAEAATIDSVAEQTSTLAEDLTVESVPAVEAEAHSEPVAESTAEPTTEPATQSAEPTTEHTTEPSAQTAA